MQDHALRANVQSVAINFPSELGKWFLSTVCCARRCPALDTGTFTRVPGIQHELQCVEGGECVEF